MWIIIIYEVTLPFYTNHHMIDYLGIIFSKKLFSHAFRSTASFIKMIRIQIVNFNNYFLIIIFTKDIKCYHLFKMRRARSCNNYFLHSWNNLHSPVLIHLIEFVPLHQACTLFHKNTSTHAIFLIVFLVALLFLCWW